MIIPDKEIEQMGQLMKNYSHAVQIFREMRKEEKDNLEKFIDEMKGIFSFIDTLEYEEAPKLFTEQFDPSLLAVSVRLIADANKNERLILELYRKLLLNRLNSYTKNRRLLYDILLAYFMQFINCLEDHENQNKTIQRLLILSAIGMQTRTTDSFMNFIEGPLNEAIGKKKKELEKGLRIGQTSAQSPKQKGWRSKKKSATQVQ